MKYTAFLFLLTTFSLKAFSQLDYYELRDLNTICKKEDFEAVKTFLKVKGYEITKDNENYDHGNYFVLAEISARVKVGKRNLSYLEGTELSEVNNIYDEIEIEFLEYDFSKKLRLSQSFSPGKLSLMSNKRKFDPLINWLYEDWDYIDDDNGAKVWERNSDGEINSQEYKKYLTSKEFREKDKITLLFRKTDVKTGERLWYNLFYEYQDLTKENISLSDYMRVSTSIILTTEIPKGADVKSENRTILFPLFKSGASYLLKIRFGNIFKTYLLDSGASDMTLDDDTYQYFKRTNQLGIANILTSREYILADGTKKEYKRIRIPTFTINNMIVKNIDAVLVGNGKPLLLGKSFLDSFKSWKIDNKTSTLILETF